MTPEQIDKLMPAPDQLLVDYYGELWTRAQVHATVLAAIADYRAQADKQGQAMAYGFESGLVQLLNEARCHSARTVGNRELAAKIIEYMKLYASTPQVAQPLAVERIEELARRIAWRYKKSSDPHHSDTYTFNRDTLIQFAAAMKEQSR